MKKWWVFLLAIVVIVILLILALLLNRSPVVVDDNQNDTSQSLQGKTPQVVTNQTPQELERACGYAKTLSDKDRFRFFSVFLIFQALLALNRPVALLDI